MASEKCQVLLYTSYLHIIGGIETFVYNFVDLMKDTYDIVLMSKTALPPETARKLKEKVRVIQGIRNIECETLIMIRKTDAIPPGVTYKKSVRMCHAMKTKPDSEILLDCDEVMFVSEAAKESFGMNGTVIHNPLQKTKEEALILVSATRIPAKDKGENKDRMLQLARMLEAAGIRYLWFNFSDAPLQGAPKGLVNVGAIQDVQPFIARADYLVQLSDHEGFCYTIIEALTNGTAVICTPFETTKELGVEDGVNGYVVPFDMSFNVRQLLNVPKFEYTYDNRDIVKAWKKILGKKKASEYKPPEHEKEIPVRILRTYKDIWLDKKVLPGEVYMMPAYRVETLTQKRCVEVI